MCCFSKHVELVTDTDIFARASKNEWQFLVYAMRFKAGEDLSMILPLPVPKDSKEDAVRFINLEKYPAFFDEMLSGFPIPGPAPGFVGGRPAIAANLPKLAVIEVGRFVASFVPTVADFSRLDERFRLPTEVWDKLPAYKHYGFAVFQLKKGDMKVHPMAFEFPRADPKKLFFPTVHIHDGEVHAKAAFDHMLFCQPSATDTIMDWQESPQPAELFMKNLDKAQGIVDPKGHCYRKILKGTFDNKDLWV
jgi:hypothetical protein